MAAFHPYTLTQTLAENSITPLQDTPLHSTKVNELFHTFKSPNVLNKKIPIIDLKY